MNIGIGVSNIYTEAGGIIDGYRIIKESGFDAVDANICRVLPSKDINSRKMADILLGSDHDLLDFYLPWKQGAELYGLDNYQAHAVYPTYGLDGADDPYNDFLITALKKNIMACDYIGCRNLVVHPAFCDYEHRTDPETEWKLNIDRYSQLIPEAKKYGVTICLENVFTSYKGKIYADCCSDMDMACRYIDTLNGIAGEKVFGFCLDTGHLLLTSTEIKQAMIKLGDRLAALHVHDNNGLTDQHLAPYMGILDWDGFIEGLAAVRFNKTMCFETFRIWSVFDHELCPDVMKLIAKTGRMFASRAKALCGE